MRRKVTGMLVAPPRSSFVVIRYADALAKRERQAAAAMEKRRRQKGVLGFLGALLLLARCSSCFICCAVAAPCRLMPGLVG